MTYPLEPSSPAMRSMIDSAAAYLIDFIERLPDSPASNLQGAVELARKLREPAPSTGVSFDSLLAVVSEAADRAFNPAGPGYLAYIPGGGIFAAAVADLIACVINRFVNLSVPAPALVQLEANVVRWLCDLFGYPEESLGILTSGGSMANFSSVIAARKARLAENFLDGTLYVSDQVHLSVIKAAMIAGFPLRNVRTIPTTPEMRIDLDALRSALKEDRESRLQPFYVVASAGTTNTGTVDPISDLGDVARDEGLWLHVDAAYGGFFQLTERGRRLFRGIEDADSITLDPHKGMFLPYGTGCLLVREAVRLREAHHVTAEYLQDLAGEAEIPNFSEYSPELSRDFRGLRVWLPIKLHGLDSFRAALDEKLDLARFLYDSLRETPGFELEWEPDLSTVPFRYVPERGDPEGFNRQLLDRINRSKRVFLSSTTVGGRFIIRACILSHRTHRDRVEEALDIIRGAAKELEREG